MYGIITYKQQLVDHFIHSTPRCVPLLTHTVVFSTYYAAQIKISLYYYEQINVCLASVSFVSYILAQLVFLFLFSF